MGLLRIEQRAAGGSGGGDKWSGTDAGGSWVGMVSAAAANAFAVLVAEWHSPTLAVAAHATARAGTGSGGFECARAQSAETHIAPAG